MMSHTMHGPSSILILIKEVLKLPLKIRAPPSIRIPQGRLEYPQRSSSVLLLSLFFSLLIISLIGKKASDHKHIDVPVPRKGSF